MRVLFIRVPHYFGDLNGTPKKENYLSRGLGVKAFLAELLKG